MPAELLPTYAKSFLTTYFDPPTADCCCNVEYLTPSLQRRADSVIRSLDSRDCLVVVMELHKTWRRMPIHTGKSAAESPMRRTSRRSCASLQFAGWRRV